MCSKPVLNVLTLEQRKERVFTVEMFLNDCEADPTLLGWIIMGDESWVFEYDPSTKSQSIQRRQNGEPRHKKARMALFQ